MSVLINILRALAVKFTPAGTITSTNVQDAITEEATRVTSLDANNVKLNGNQNITGLKSFTNTTESTSSTTGTTFAGGIGVGGNLYLAPNKALFVGESFFPPTFDTRSIGTKVVFYPEVGIDKVDYAMGIASGVLWYSLPQNNSTRKFVFYGGITEVASIDGIGIITGFQYRLSALNTAPTSATDTGTTGETREALSGGIYYRYLCVDTNTWVRTAYTTW